MSSYVVNLETGTVCDASAAVVVDWDELTSEQRQTLECGGAASVAQAFGDLLSVADLVSVPVRSWFDRSAELAAVIDGAPGLVASVRSWFDKVNGNSYLAGDIVEVFTGRIIPLPFQYGRDCERAVRAAVIAAGGELADARLLIFETEVRTQRACRHGGLVSFCRPVVGS